jgi:lambda family phage tail tape measure protein
VREAIALVNEEVRKGNYDLSERQMVLIETIRQMEVESNTLRTGLQAGFSDFAQYAGDLAQQGQRAASDIAFGMSANLGDAIFEIGRDFDNAGDAAEEFGRRTLESIGRIASELAALQILKSSFGSIGLGSLLPGASAAAPAAAAAGNVALFAQGGVATGGLGDLKPVYGYANGGPVVRTPHTAVIGEGQYNEAIVPLPDGNRIPVELRDGGGRGSGSPITITQQFSFTIQAERRPGDRGELSITPATARQIQDLVAQGIRGGNQGLRAEVRKLRG